MMKRVLLAACSLLLSAAAANAAGVNAQAVAEHVIGGLVVVGDVFPGHRFGGVGGAREQGRQGQRDVADHVARLARAAPTRDADVAVWAVQDLLLQVEQLGAHGFPEALAFEQQGGHGALLG